MRVAVHFTDKGYKCAMCNYTAFRWYAFDDEDDPFTIEDGRPNWLCQDCIMDYIVTHCEVMI